MQRVTSTLTGLNPIGMEKPPGRGAQLQTAGAKALEVDTVQFSGRFKRTPLEEKIIKKYENNEIYPWFRLKAKIEKKGLPVDLRLKNGDTLLMHALKRHLILTTFGLLKKGADVDARNKDGETPIMLAAKFDTTSDQERLKAILRETPDLKAVDKSSRNALLYAMAAPDTENTLKKLELLIQAGANVDQQDAEGQTILMKAIQKGRTDVIEQLLDYGADVTIRDHAGQTALDWVTTMSRTSERKKVSNWLQGGVEGASAPVTMQQSDASRQQAELSLLHRYMKLDRESRDRLFSELISSSAETPEVQELVQQAMAEVEKRDRLL